MSASAKRRRRACHWHKAACRWRHRGRGAHQWAPASSSSLRRQQQVGAKAPLRGPGLRGPVIVTWQRGTVGTARSSGSGRGGLRVEGTEQQKGKKRRRTGTGQRDSAAERDRDREGQSGSGRGRLGVYVTERYRDNGAEGQRERDIEVGTEGRRRACHWHKAACRRRHRGRGGGRTSGPAAGFKRS